ncbi:hypothetical protein NLJ89_g11887 [Agrocybe chaxingu]|uniref:Uncharacterized protein n=1 Tax=Agrocybe chaxingu TaxID=84603 RepID=A0A9W8JL33_9AGAR|nr:hypothetical protein NLJ89_g11887 [Agrocybe chaxingu]
MEDESGEEEDAGEDGDGAVARERLAVLPHRGRTEQRHPPSPKPQEAKSGQTLETESRVAGPICRNVGMCDDRDRLPTSDDLLSSAFNRILDHAMDTRSVLVLLLGSVVAALADDDAEFVNDPYLAFRPAFARSLPVQIMLTGVVLTLVAVLFIHLMFTAQYHWPLAPVNYVLQLSGVTTLLISLIATIHVVLSATMAESEKWPYMLSYIAVNVPPLDLDNNTEGWSIAERATWLVMNASTSGLIQITHIQFLTLLYPSRLEGRLIFALLGPLAVVAAVMQLLPISGSTAANNIASAVRNVCNAALSLLFTVALFIWGLLVNRKQAWRTDGGTAVFGCAALSLAVVSTALNFLYVHKEEEFVVSWDGGGG